MKNLKLILLLQALMLGVLTLNAEECPCDGGTADYSFDCDDDGTMDACSADECPAPSVSITSGGGDVKKGCSVTWNCSPSGGSGDYSYSWSFSTGNASGTNQSKTATAGVLGAGTATITVTDDISGQTASDTANYHVRKEVEATETSSETIYPDGQAHTAMTAVLACPTNSPTPCQISYTTSSDFSFAIGTTVTGGGNIGLIKTEVSGSVTSTHTTGSGATYQYGISAGQSAYIGGRSIAKKREGTWNEYDCSGLKKSGNWTDKSVIGTGAEYSLITVN